MSSMIHHENLDILPFLSKPPSCLAIALNAEDLLLYPALVRAHPLYNHELLLVRPHKTVLVTGTEWTLPAYILSPFSTGALGGSLRSMISADTGLELRGVVGGGIVESMAQRRSIATSSNGLMSHAGSPGSGLGATKPQGAVFYVMKAEGGLNMANDVCAEWMWAKAAEIPALQIQAEMKGAIEQAFKIAGLVG